MNVDKTFRRRSLFLYPLKIIGKLRFSDVVREYRDVVREYRDVVREYRDVVRKYRDGVRKYRE